MDPIATVTSALGAPQSTAATGPSQADIQKAADSFGQQLMQMIFKEIWNSVQENTQ